MFYTVFVASYCCCCCSFATVNCGEISIFLTNFKCFIVKETVAKRKRKMQVFVVVFSYFVFVFFFFVLLLLFNILCDCKAYFMASPDLNKTHTLSLSVAYSFSLSFFYILTQNPSLQGLTSHIKTIMMFIMYYKELQYAVQFIYPLRSFCFLSCFSFFF